MSSPASARHGPEPVSTGPDSPPRILCIAGSPRKASNSAALLDSCIAGIQSAGGLADTLVLAGTRLPGCTGCGLCAPTGSCALNDAMTPIYPRLDAAEAIVVASPVYFASVPARLKSFIDRCQPYWARRYLLGRPIPEPRRPGAIMLVRAGGDPFGPECASTPLRSAFAVLGFAVDEYLDVVGPDGPGEIGRERPALEAARAIGVRLARAVIARRGD